MDYNTIATVWVYLDSFSCCWLPNLRNLAKFWQNSSLQQFKVIQGHWPWCQSKAKMQLSICDFDRVSYHFRDIDI